MTSAARVATAWCRVVVLAAAFLWVIGRPPVNDMVNIDECERVKEASGLVQADQVTQRIVVAIRHCVDLDRELLARYDSARFAVLLLGCTPEQARERAEDIRLAIQRVSQHTSSVGIASSQPIKFGSPDILVAQAAHAVLRACCGGLDVITV